MHVSRWIRLSLSSVVLIAVACSPIEESPAIQADLIFVGDHIITMDDSDVTAVAVTGDRIIASGDVE